MIQLRQIKPSCNKQQIWMRILAKILVHICHILKIVVGGLTSRMVSHKRLQQYEHHYGTVCVTGVLGCRWHRYQQSMQKWTKYDVVWFLGLVAVLTYVTFWLYFFILAENSRDLINWYLYYQTGRTDVFFTIFLVVCLLFAYITLLMLLSLCHICVGHEVYIHWAHRCLVTATLICCVLLTIAVDMIWAGGWRLLSASIEMAGPFLHVCLVAVMTMLTWFIASQCLLISKRAWQCVAIFIYSAVMLAIYIFPAFLNCPCVINHDELPPKPLLSAHRGGAAVAPENTDIAFQYAAYNYSAYMLETDVTISYDGVPFLMHDGTLRRTTNVSEEFPDRVAKPSCMFNMSDLLRLNAGSWFLQTDPFKTVGDLSQYNRELYSHQKILLFEDFLRIAKQADRFIMFDEDETCPDHHPFFNKSTDIILNITEQSTFNKNKILWLDHETYNDKRTADFIKVSAKDRVTLEFMKRNNITHANADFVALSTPDVRRLLDHNISVNMFVVDSPWLFSLYWCVGVNSITTNQIHNLHLMNAPVWRLSPQQFLMMWVISDVMSVIICIVIWIVHKKKPHLPSESLTLHGPRLRKNNHQRNRTMKQKLLLTAESIQDIDAIAESSVPSPTTPSSVSQQDSTIRDSNVPMVIINQSRFSARSSGSWGRGSHNGSLVLDDSVSDLPTFD